MIAHFNEAITQSVNQLTQEKKPLAQRSTYGKAFLQLMNLWRTNEVIQQNSI